MSRLGIRYICFWSNGCVDSLRVEVVSGDGIPHYMLDQRKALKPRRAGVLPAVPSAFTVIVHPFDGSCFVHLYVRRTRTRTRRTGREIIRIRI